LGLSYMSKVSFIFNYVLFWVRLPCLGLGAALGSAKSLRTWLWLTLLYIKLLAPVCVPVKKPIFVFMKSYVCLFSYDCCYFLRPFISNSSFMGMVALSNSPLYISPFCRCVMKLSNLFFLSDSAGNLGLGNYVYPSNLSFRGKYIYSVDRPSRLLGEVTLRPSLRLSRAYACLYL